MAEDRGASGERDLGRLLAHLDPDLYDIDYVFTTAAEAAYGDLGDLSWFAAIQEPEGLTLILHRDDADAAGLPYETVFRRITLGVHSSLEAVGLTAAVASRLEEEGISANMVAGYYHDHVFVPAADAERALAALRALGAG